MSDPDSEFGGGQWFALGEFVEDLHGHTGAQFGVHGRCPDPLPALPQQKVREVVRPDEAGFVRPILHHPARMLGRHPVQNGTVVISEPGKEGQIVAAGKDVDGVNLDQVQPVKGTAHRPCSHGSGGPSFVQSLGCQSDAPCLVEAQRCAHVSPSFGWSTPA